MHFQAIGYVQNRFDEPVRPDVLLGAQSRIVLEPDLGEGLLGLEAGQKILVIFHFHRFEGQEYELHQHPRGDRSRPKRGVFALCSPHRPNAIGATVVELLAVDANTLQVMGLDAINGTPVLDIKPADYVCASYDANGDAE